MIGPIELIQKETLENIIFAVVWSECLIIIWIFLRQIKLISNQSTFPVELEEFREYYDQVTFNDSGEYMKERLVQQIFVKFGKAVIITITIKTHAIYKIWEFAGYLSDGLNFQFFQNIFYLLSCIVIYKILQFIPEYWNTVIERNHGFYNASMTVWARQYIRHTFFKLLITPFVERLAMTGLSMLMVLVNEGYWISLICLGILFWITFPTVCVMYSFSKKRVYRKLRKGELKFRLQALADRVGFPRHSIRVLTTSKSKVHPNAFNYSFMFYSRLVIYDSLINGKGAKLEPKHIEAVVAHELGHFSSSHSVINVTFLDVLILLIIGNMMWLLRWSPMYEIFGFQNQMTTQDEMTKLLAPGMTILQMVVISFPTQIIQTLFSSIVVQRLEIKADNFAVQLGYGNDLQEALVKIAKENCEYPQEDYFFSIINSSHPCLLDRIRNVKELMKEIN